MARWKISLRRKNVYKREHERGISLGGEGGKGDVGILSSERGEGVLGGGGVEARMMNI